MASWRAGRSRRSPAGGVAGRARAPGLGLGPSPTSKLVAGPPSPPSGGATSGWSRSISTGRWSRVSLRPRRIYPIVVTLLLDPIDDGAGPRGTVPRTGQADLFEISGNVGPMYCWTVIVGLGASGRPAEVEPSRSSKTFGSLGGQATEHEASGSCGSPAGGPGRSSTPSKATPVISDAASSGRPASTARRPPPA